MQDEEPHMHLHIFWRKVQFRLLIMQISLLHYVKMCCRWKKDKLRDQWGIENEISKLIMALYDETANSEGRIHKQIAAKCLDLWDIMFEKQLGAVREISYKLMDR